MARLLIGGAVVDADDLVDQRARVQGRHDPCHSHLLVGRPARSPRPTVSHAPGGPASRLTAAGGAHARSRPRRAPSSVCEPSLGEPGGPGRADAGRAHPPRSSRASADQGSGTLEERERRWRLAGRVRFSAGTIRRRRSGARARADGRGVACAGPRGRPCRVASSRRQPSAPPSGAAAARARCRGRCRPSSAGPPRAGTPRPFARRVRGTPCPRAGQRVRRRSRHPRLAIHPARTSLTPGPPDGRVRSWARRVDVADLPSLAEYTSAEWPAWED